MEETGKPCSGGPTHSIEEYERSEDTPVGLSLEKIRRDNWRKRGHSSIPHAEEDTVKVWEQGRSVEGEEDQNDYSTNQAENPHGKGDLPSDSIRQSPPQDLRPHTRDTNDPEDVGGEEGFQPLIHEEGNLMGEN